MDEATLQAVSDQNFTALTLPQQAAVAVAEDIKRNNGASAATFERARQFFSPEQLVELCLVAGYYIMTAGFLLSFDVEIEDGAPLGESMRAGASR